MMHEDESTGGEDNSEHGSAHEEGESEQESGRPSSSAMKRPRSSSGASQGHGEGVLMSKLLNVLTIGSFDEFIENAHTIPRSYSPAMVSKVVPDSVWPLGWCSRRKFFGWNGSGPMRNYICTVNSDPERAETVIFKIIVEDDPADATTGTSPEELIATFRSRFLKLNLNAVHNSWIKSTEFFFGFHNPIIQKKVHALPGHDEILEALRPLRDAMKEPKVMTADATDEEEDDENGDEESGKEHDEEQQDYSQLTETRAQEILKKRESEKATLVEMVSKATQTLQRLKDVNDEWMQLEQKRVCRALKRYTKDTEAVVVTQTSAP